MNSNPTEWNGYPVHGDITLLDYIVESDGYINLDKDDIVNTLSMYSQNYVVSCRADNLADAFTECVSKLSDSFCNAKKSLFNLYVAHGW